ncbi:MAG TPA: GMC family oxidoreductase [Spirochaetia bacterium]|nr:GMC family oxidoreductase [Spirochaetia bacterium]
MSVHADVVIIGSGLGGSAIARSLAGTGLSVLMLERGDFVRQEPQNWDVQEVSLRRRYDAGETWMDGQGRPFVPRAYYNVGGATKFFGGSALRLRPSDFTARELDGGATVGWPYDYEELEPWYAKAEALMEVHGQAGEDPTEGPRGSYPRPALEHEPVIAAVAEKLAAQGLHPFHLPVAVDQGPKGRCVKGSPCDGFPCKVRAKGDAENRILRPLLLRKEEWLQLRTGCRVQRLETDATGRRVVAALVQQGDETLRVEGGTFVAAAGAVNSAVLLLRSASDAWPDGLANSRGLVGRHFMAHNNTVVMALSPFRLNPTVFQKTLAVHDYYAAEGPAGQALGAVQCRGKVKAEMLRGRGGPLYRRLAGPVAERSVDFWLMTEDLPLPENRVSLDASGRICLDRRPSNAEAHRELVRRFVSHLRRAGLPITLVDERGVDAIQHQCGTLRFGADPQRSVLDPWCRSHDVQNLWVVDASFLPSSAAVNPSLTILAQALRAGARLRATLAPTAPEST